MTASRSVLRAAADGPHFGAEQLHAVDVRRLAADVLLAHVDDAVEAEVGTGGRGRHAVLPGAGLGDHPLLAHPQREQRLAERVVDLVRAGVVQVFALQPDLRPAALLGQPLGEIQRRRPADVVLQAGHPARPETAGSCRAFSYSAVSSSRARVSVSGTYRPPNAPNRPAASGTCVSAVGSCGSGGHAC